MQQAFHKTSDKTSDTTRIWRMFAYILGACALAMALLIATGDIAWADAKSDLDAANKTASAASQSYDRAKRKLDKLDSAIAKKDAKISKLEDEKIPKARADYASAVRQLYKSSGNIFSVIAALFSGGTLKETLAALNACEKIADWRQDAMNELKAAKAELEETKAGLSTDRAKAASALREAKKKKRAALAAQEKARKAYQDTLPKDIPPTSSSSRRAPTSSSFHDEASARAFIVNKESGGSYTARNGIYYGAYQLTSSYLHGDYSPENQDRTAERYVKGRYGSWMAAARFWVSHHWY